MPDHQSPTGLWLPLITPFRDGALDEASLLRLLGHYAAEPIDGIILAATTGEGLTLDAGERARLVDIAATALGGRIPLYLGLAGSDTRAGIRELEATAGWPVDGYLITCPHYSRPSQQGLAQHFTALAAATPRPVLIYNIPYRTGVNLGNAAMLELAALPNIVGVKDCCADATQSFDLLRRRPAGFSVLTGEDALFYTALTQGAQGGILAAAHVATAEFAAIRTLVDTGSQHAALLAWQRLADIPRLLFAEPNPAPIKHWLWRTGLIASPELRLPMTGITAPLADRLDREIAGRQALAAA